MQIFIWCHIPIDSSMNSLSKVFWIRFDRTKCSGTNDRRARKRREMALTDFAICGQTLRLIQSDSKPNMFTVSRAIDWCRKCLHVQRIVHFVPWNRYDSSRIHLKIRLESALRHSLVTEASCSFQDFAFSLMKDHCLAFRQIVARRITPPPETSGAACSVNAHLI